MISVFAEIKLTLEVSEVFGTRVPVSVTCNVEHIWQRHGSQTNFVCSESEAFQRSFFLLPWRLPKQSFLWVILGGAPRVCDRTVVPQSSRRAAQGRTRRAAREGGTACEAPEYQLNLKP